MKLTILEALAALHTHWDRATTAVGAHADIDQRWIDGLLGHAVSANHQLSLIGDLAAESTVADAARRALVQDCLVLGALALDGVLGYAGDPADVSQPGDPTMECQRAALAVLIGGAVEWKSALVLAEQNARERLENVERQLQDVTNNYSDLSARYGALECTAMSLRMEHTEAMLTKDALAANLQQIYDALDMADAPSGPCMPAHDRVAALAAQRDTADGSVPAMLALAGGRLRDEVDTLTKQLEAARTALDAAHAPGGHDLAVDARIAALAEQRRQAVHNKAIADVATDRLLSQIREIVGVADAE